MEIAQDSSACRSGVKNTPSAVEYLETLDGKQRAGELVDILAEAVSAHLKRSSSLRKESPLRLGELS